VQNRALPVEQGMCQQVRNKQQLDFSGHLPWLMILL
jgi:hypothetical protein